MSRQEVYTITSVSEERTQVLAGRELRHARVRRVVLQMTAQWRSIVPRGGRKT